MRLGRAGYTRQSTDVHSLFTGVREEVNHHRGNGHAASTEHHEGALVLVVWFEFRDRLLDVDELDASRACPLD